MPNAIFRDVLQAPVHVDDIGSYATNEVAINSNSALALLTAFAGKS